MTSPKAKNRQFTDDQIFEIKEMKKEGYTVKQIMDVFKCSQSNISLILNNKIYKEVL